MRCIVAALLMIIVLNPLNPFNDKDVVIIKDPNTENMEILVKEGEKMDRYGATEQIGQGHRADIAYRMKDGSFIYVPE